VTGTGVTGTVVTGAARRRHLVVGAGGLLGGAVVAALEADGRDVTRARVPWHDPSAAVSVLSSLVRDLLVDGAPWSLIWAAGAGVVASGADARAEERSVVARVLSEVAAAIAADPARASRGSVFVASSAGGTFAGSVGAPFDETTEARPLAPYGWSKLAVETLFRDWSAKTGVPVVIGRYSNLYGPGQDLSKAQGLVSQLCLAHLQGRPSSIYVPIDTIRDYLFVDDAAAMTVEAVDRAAALPAGTVVLKVLASQQGVTIGSLISELQRIVKRKPRIVMGSHFTASVQAPDLRFGSVVWPEIDRRMLTPLPAGIHRTLLSLQAGLR
jgi:UDP-glucose 4-epimerase